MDDVIPVAGPTDDPPTVLVVDDEPGLADLYAAWLGDRYETRVAYGGEEALDRLNEHVDVVLLDRRMPDRSGDEVLTEIRRGPADPMVAMVTAVYPDFDVLELGFDDYLTKPVSQDELNQVVETLLAVAAYDETVDELYRLSAARSALEAEKPAEELADHPGYRDLLDRMAALQAAADEAIETATKRDPAALFHAIAGTGEIDA